MLFKKSIIIAGKISGRLIQSQRVAGSQYAYIAADHTVIFRGYTIALLRNIESECDKKFVLDYLVIGKDPYPTVGVSTTAKVLILNGNSALANTGFFIPLNLEVIRGTTVIWQNEDNIGHTVQSQDAKGNIIPLFNSNVLKTGDTFSYKFEKPGVYHYFCTIHPWRIGIVTVS